jgi:hypothetical protein
LSQVRPFGIALAMEVRVIAPVNIASPLRVIGVILANCS